MITDEDFKVKLQKYMVENPTAIALNDLDLCKELHQLLSYEQNEKCPFCKKLKCNHWTGFGWKNPNIKEGT